jgi:TolA-binding protein
VRFVLVVVLAGCTASPPSPLTKLRGQVAEVTARAHAVMAAAHTDAELRAARATLIDLQLELSDLSERIEQLSLQSRR